MERWHMRMSRAGTPEVIPPVVGGPVSVRVEPLPSCHTLI